MPVPNTTAKTASGSVALDHVEFTPSNVQDVSKSSGASAVDIEHASTPVVTPDEVQKYTKADDEAMKAMAQYDGPPLVLDEATSRRLLRKIDWHIMPILYGRLLAHTLCNTDKVADSFAGG